MSMGQTKASPLEARVIDHLRDSGQSSVDLKLDESWLSGISEDPNLLVWRMAQKGLLHRIQNGRYVKSEPGSRSNSPVFNSLEWLPSAVLARLDREYYVSWQTALYHHRLIEQQPRVVFVAVTRRKRDTAIGPFELQFVTIAKRKFFGFDEIELPEGKACIADLEKSIIDALDQPKISAPVPLTIAGMAQAWRGGRLDPERLVSYAHRFDSPTLNRRLGFFMDHFEIPHAEELLGELGRGHAVPLRPGRPTSGLEVDRKWRVAIDKRLLAVAEQPK